jgi:LysM repeat protein
MRQKILIGLGAAICLAAAAPMQAQSNIEPGLEAAVNWKWRVAPSEPRQWISVLPDPTPEPRQALPTPTPVVQRLTYEVKKGDALAIIARKYGLLPVHLKSYNGLTSDLIQIGQVLNIPTLDEARAIAPLPEPPKKKEARKKGEDPGLTKELLEVAALQTFLDRRNFSTGPISGKRTPLFEKVLHMFTLGHPEAADSVRLAAAIQAEVGTGVTSYVLKESDFRFISPPKAERPDARADPDKKPSLGPSYQDLVEAPLLIYRTPWEFVAERFHCDETFLKKLNSHVKAAPTAGTELRVPNVLPFEIEKGFWGVLQPPPGREAVKAVILDLELLQIFQNEALVAVMPISMARPGLRGKGSWTILHAMPLPRLGTFQEPREQVQRPKPLFGQPDPEPTPEKPATLAAEQFLAPGPNNPVGVVWIDLAKAGSEEPLPYGLHGTSIPDTMRTHYGIGGIQLANWNIVRAARLLPLGTELEWKQGLRAPAPGVAPGVAPAAVPVAR